jgi:hypothetical protein
MNFLYLPANCKLIIQNFHLAKHPAIFLNSKAPKDQKLLAFHSYSKIGSKDAQNSRKTKDF